MAQSDLDSMSVKDTAPKTAYDNISEWVESPNDVENRAAAKAAGVKDAAYIDYDVALENYESRPDIENLARKNARNNPQTFADAAFMRSVDADAIDGGSSAP